MLVNALLFASLKDQLGASVSVEVAEEAPGLASTRAFRAAVKAAHPVLARYGRGLLVAVNEAYARDEDPIRPGDVVALIPPVAGG